MALELRVSLSVAAERAPSGTPRAPGEFAPAARPPDYSLSGFTARVKAVAAGHADFALTSVVYLLAAQTEAAGSLPVRFVATAHQRNPIAGVVGEDCGMRTPEDLAGARTARWSMPWFAQEYAGALNVMGVGALVMIDTPGDLDPALGSDEVDVLPVWMDDATRAGLQGMRIHHRGAAFDVRAIPLDIPVYTTGLVAADRSLRRHQVDARRVHRRIPPPAGAARTGVGRLQPLLLERTEGACPGQTIAHTAKTHGLATFPGDQIYRPELLTPARDRVAKLPGVA